MRHMPLVRILMAGSQDDSQARDLSLFHAARPGDSLDLPPALITGCEVAAGIDGRGILLQLGVDQADRLENLVEVQVRQSPQTAERLGCGHALLRLARVFHPDHGKQRLSELGFHPELRPRQRLFVALKLLGKTRQEMGRQSVGFRLHPGQSGFQLRGSLAGAGDQAVRPQESQLSLLLTPAGAACQSHQLFN